MNRYIKTLTDIAISAAVVLTLTVALLPAGAEELRAEIPEESQSSPEEPVPPETTPEPEKITQASETTTENTTTTTTTTIATTTTTTTTTAPPVTAKPSGISWTEQAVSGVMYVNTDGISSVEVAQIGSKKIKQYSLNDAVTVVALTDTEYYKLEDGTFIHADFLSYSETVITTEEESTPPVETEEPEEAGETAGEPESAEETEEEPAAIPLSYQAGAQSVELEMFEMVNEYRAANGLPALQWDYGSYSAAQIRANELLQRNSHTRPDGTRFSTVFRQIGYSTTLAAENIVYYYSAPRSALNSLISSPEHRSIILSRSYTHISIARVYDSSSRWGYYWVQEFTAP